MFANLAVQSSYLIGSCDPYVKIIVGQTIERTSVQSGTLYPEFDEEFSFFVNKDKKARKKSLSAILQVWDWDFGKKDDFIGVEVTESSTNEQHTLSPAGVGLGFWKEGRLYRTGQRVRRKLNQIL